MKNVIVSLVALAGIAGAASAQVDQSPVGATLRYEVSVNGSPFAASVNANPGDRVEWRAVVSFTGSQAAQALGRIYYQPVLVNTDNTDGGNGVDTLGAWRNNGISGQGNTTLAQGMLTGADGENTGALAGGYGRVRFGGTSRSTTAGSSGGLTGFAQNPGASVPNSVGGVSPSAGNGYIRIAGTSNPNWYPANIPSGTVALYNQVLWGVVSDNNSSISSTWFVTGTSDLVIFRQALTLSNNDALRQITLTSEASTLQRAGGNSGTDDLRFMTWAGAGENGSTATIRAGVNYVPGIINVVPTPGAVALLGLGGLVAARRRRA